MTTVAYRAGIIASDSQVSSSNFIHNEVQTKFQISDRHGQVYMFAGHLAMASALVRLVERLPEMPWISGLELELPPTFVNAEENVDLTIVTLEGKIYCIAGPHWYQVMNTDFFAIGSGTEAATAAMMMGADAIKAVEIAGRLDSHTGGDIHALVLSDIPKALPVAKKAKSSAKKKQPVE